MAVAHTLPRIRSIKQVLNDFFGSGEEGEEEEGGFIVNAQTGNGSERSWPAWCRVRSVGADFGQKCLDMRVSEHEYICSLLVLSERRTCEDRLYGPVLHQ